MALTDVKVLGEDQAPVAAAEAAVEETVVAPEAEEVKEQFNQDELGSLADKWAYVAAITDDTVKDKNTITNAKTGEKEEIVTGKIIGYVFKALENGLTYPQTEISPYYRSNMFTFKGQVVDKVAKKGEEVILTIPEALAILADPKVNGMITGGKTTVTASYQLPKAGADLNADPETLAVTGHLSPGAGTKSLKLLELRTAIVGESKPNPANPKFPTVVRSVNKGFERFAPAIAEKPRAASTAAPTSIAAGHKTHRNDKAAAFAKAFNARRG